MKHHWMMGMMLVLAGGILSVSAASESTSMYLGVYPLAARHCGCAMDPDPFDTATDPQEDGSVRSDTVLEAYLIEAGDLSFPEGSYVYCRSSDHRLCLFSDQGNHDKVSALLAETSGPIQVEIDLVLIGLPKATVEDHVRREGKAPCGAQVLGWFREGQGGLIAAAKVVTRNGVNAQFECVREIMYASAYEEFTLKRNEGTQPSNQGAMYPYAFETREVGSIFNITPTVSPDTQSVELTLAPEFCRLEGMVEHNIFLGSEAGAPQAVSWEQPEFRSLNVTTSVMVAIGDTLVLGGAVSVDDEDQLLYMAVTPRLLGDRGHGAGVGDQEPRP